MTKLGYQFSRFLIGGVIAVALDWGTYFLITQFGDLKPSISKFISFMVGTIFAFFYNGVICFQSNLGKTQFFRHLSLYTYSMIINVAVFNFTMETSPTFLGSTSIISLSLATCISMFLNFFGMRKWVFRENEIPN